MKQKVYLGKTQSGKAGLFTNGFMAIPLSLDEFEKFFSNYGACVQFAERLGFELDDQRIKK